MINVYKRKWISIELFDLTCALLYPSRGGSSVLKFCLLVALTQTNRPYSADGIVCLSLIKIIFVWMVTLGLKKCCQPSGKS